jgi:hypothetical protein
MKKILSSLLGLLFLLTAINPVIAEEESSKAEKLRVAKVAFFEYLADSAEDMIDQMTDPSRMAEFSSSGNEKFDWDSSLDSSNSDKKSKVKINAEVDYNINLPKLQEIKPDDKLFDAVRKIETEFIIDFALNFRETQNIESEIEFQLKVLIKDGVLYFAISELQLEGLPDWQLESLTWFIETHKAGWQKISFSNLLLENIWSDMTVNEFYLMAFGSPFMLNMDTTKIKQLIRSYFREVWENTSLLTMLIKPETENTAELAFTRINIQNIIKAHFNFLINHYAELPEWSRFIIAKINTSLRRELGRLNQEAVEILPEDFSENTNFRRELSRLRQEAVENVPEDFSEINVQAVFSPTQVDSLHFVNTSQKESDSYEKCFWYDPETEERFDSLYDIKNDESYDRAKYDCEEIKEIRNFHADITYELNDSLDPAQHFIAGETATRLVGDYQRDEIFFKIYPIEENLRKVTTNFSVTDYNYFNEREPQATITGNFNTEIDSEIFDIREAQGAMRIFLHNKEDKEHDIPEKIILSLNFENPESDDFDFDLSGRTVPANFMKFALQASGNLHKNLEANFSLIAELYENSVFSATANYNFAGKDFSEIVLSEEVVAASEYEFHKEKNPVSEIPKAVILKIAKPKVELFTMSHCPYCAQMEKGLFPVLDTLGDSIDFELKFVNVFNIVELKEQTLQYCIQKEYPYPKQELIDYLKCFSKSGNSESCLEENSLDTTKIDQCIIETDDEFKITENFENEIGNYPSFPIYAEDCEKYNVIGAPTLVINGVKMDSVSRDPASLLEAICSGFTDAPEACNTELSTEVPAPGFGLNGLFNFLVNGFDESIFLMRVKSFDLEI